MTNEEALERVKQITKELTRDDLTHEEVIERLNHLDKELCDERLSIIHNYPIKFDPKINDYRLKTEEEMNHREDKSNKYSNDYRVYKSPFNEWD